MIEIDGSFGEGGGQLLRTALSLSSITKKPFRIINARANREPKGLKYQHVISARAIRKISRGELKGDEIGSQELTFLPGKIVGGRYSTHVPTAAAMTLIAQTLIPPLLFASKKSYIRIYGGGTDVCGAPTFDYFENVFVPSLKALFGITISTKREKTGYYPEGGGGIHLSIKPSKPSFVDVFAAFNNKTFESIKGIIRLSHLPEHIAYREKAYLMNRGIENIHIVNDKRTESKGNSITLWSGFRGASSVGRKGKRAEVVADEVFSSMKESLEFDVDPYLADQIMIYAAVSTYLNKKEVTYTSTITKHTLSNAYVIKKFLNVDIKLENNKISFLPID